MLNGMIAAYNNQAYGTGDHLNPAARVTGDSVRSEKNPCGFHDALSSESIFARNWAETQIHSRTTVQRGEKRKTQGSCMRLRLRAEACCQHPRAGHISP